MDISFDVNKDNRNIKFNFRAAGLITRNNKLLIMIDEGIEHYYFPGGRVKLTETTSQAVIREVCEELGVYAESVSLAAVNENFFQINGTSYHEIGFFYNVKISDDALPANDEFEMTDTDGVKHHYRFVDIDDIENIFVYPVSVKKRIHEILYSNTIIHTIDTE